MTDLSLGEPLGAQLETPVGRVQLHRGGVTVVAGDIDITALFALPPIGRPTVTTGDAASAPVFAMEVQAQGTGWSVETLPGVLGQALDGRLRLAPTGQAGDHVPITVAPAAQPVPTPGTFVVDARAAAMLERTLYDVLVTPPDAPPVTVAPHAVYHRATWSDFGMAHLTDMHVARRIDRFRALLAEAGRPAAAERVINYNNRFRGFVAYANYLHDLGILDVIVATGDLFDYAHEADDDHGGPGNAGFLRELILGQSASTDFGQPEELRVPIFTVPGNHDYRRHPYRLIFDLRVSIPGTGIGKDVYRVNNFGPFNLRRSDATVLANRLDNSALGTFFGDDFVPSISPDAAARMVAIDEDNTVYRAALGDGGSYVVRLGRHRIVMLDSAHDVGVVTSISEYIAERAGFLGEDAATFLGGSPNCVGPSPEDLATVADELAATPPGGLFLVGLHAPLVNLWHDEYPYFLRETQRPGQARQVEAFLRRHDGLVGIADPHDIHRTWYPDAASPDTGEPAFVKRIDNADRLDWGVSRGRAEALMALLAGAGGGRPADVVLAGHTHLHNEFVVRLLPSGEPAFFTDFYTHNPSTYYPSRFAPDPAEFLTSDRAWTTVADGSAADGSPTLIEDCELAYEVAIPPYADPLASAPDPAAWWSTHRPLLLQTAALGPIRELRRLSGFRVLTVAADTITAIHSISIDRLEAAGYVLAWEDAIRPDPPLLIPSAPWLPVSEGATVPGGHVAAIAVGSVVTIVTSDVNGGVFACAGRPGHWSGWESVSGGVTVPGAPISLVAVGDTITVLLANADGTVFACSGRPGDWGLWETVADGGTTPGGNVTACVRYLRHGLRVDPVITVAVADRGGGVFACSGTPGHWLGWEPVSQGGTTPGARVAIVARGEWVTLLVADVGGGVFACSGRPGQWNGWETVSAGATTPGGALTCVVTGDLMTVFTADPAGGVYAASGHPGDWGPWDTVSGGATLPGAPIAALAVGDSIVILLADRLGGVYRTSGTRSQGFSPWQPVAEGVSMPGAHLAAVVTDPVPGWGDDLVVTCVLADPAGGVYARSVRVDR